MKVELLPFDDVDGRRLFHLEDEEVSVVFIEWGLVAMERPLFSLSWGLLRVWWDEELLTGAGGGGWAVLNSLLSLQRDSIIDKLLIKIIMLIMYL